MFIKTPFKQLKEYMAPIIGEKFKAKKDGYLVEPQNNAFYQWENFNTSNPTVMRLDGIVILGYRAGGCGNSYLIGAAGDKSWGSELGIALLDSRGKSVEVRFPLPIFRSQRRVELPQTEEEYNDIAINHPDEDIAYHDFRLIDMNGYIYIYYHNGKIAKFYDSIVRMSRDKFKAKILNCRDLTVKNAVDMDEWFKIWADSEWENAGVDGTRDFYPSVLPKNNITIYKLKDGTIACTHRPAPDNAIMTLGDKLYADATADKISKMGALETCVRADCFDNSHLGSNGSETVATIKGKEFLIDVTHGVHNLAFAISDTPKWNLCYMPFFRVKDYATGEVLYWSKTPVMEIDDTWSEYAYYGNWVRYLENFVYTTFPGGQLPEEEGKNSENDLFFCPIGLGDTATGRLSFKISDLVAQETMQKLSDYNEYNVKKKSLQVPENTYNFTSKISGWDFSIANIDNQLTVISHIKNDKIDETNLRPLHKDAQSFDFNMSIFDGESMFYDDNVGYFALFQGVSFTKENGEDISNIGYGVIIMHKENPNRILYRSFDSVVPIVKEKGITYSKQFKKFSKEEVLNFIPQKTRDIRAKMTAFEPHGCCYASTHTQWLKNKASGKVDF